MADRFRLTAPELDEYFERICLPVASRIYDASVLDPGQQLAYLRLLNKHQGCKVPWENLSQHYSWHRVVNVEPRHLFKKIVRQPGRGGYCMEVNHFFHIVLFSLRFHAFMVGSRIFDSGKQRFGGWTHVVNVVVIGECKYMLDWGYGSQGPCHPVPIVPDQVSIQVAPAQMRLLHRSMPQNVDQTQKVWIYQHRYDAESDWVTHYCFVDTEFTPEDIGSMNFAPWLNPRSFFTHKVVAVRFTTDREHNDDDPASLEPSTPFAAALEGEIDGAIVLNHDVLKWRRHGVKVREIRFTTDNERVAALRKYFGILLPDEDVDAIKGAAAEIGSSALSHE